MALMSVFSTKTFLALSFSFSLRSFWYGAAALSVASTANLLTGPYNRNNSLYWRPFCDKGTNLGQQGIHEKNAVSVHNLALNDKIDHNIPLEA